jgi:hypothetical protein
MELIVVNDGGSELHASIFPAERVGDEKQVVDKTRKIEKARRGFLASHYLKAPRAPQGSRPSGGRRTQPGNARRG